MFLIYLQIHFKKCLLINKYFKFFINYLQVDIILDRYTRNPKFRGVRNILEGEADDWLNHESVHRGLGTLYAVLSTVSRIQS